MHLNCTCDNFKQSKNNATATITTTCNVSSLKFKLKLIVVSYAEH